MLSSARLRPLALARCRRLRDRGSRLRDRGSRRADHTCGTLWCGSRRGGSRAQDILRRFPLFLPRCLRALVLASDVQACGQARGGSPSMDLIGSGAWRTVAWEQVASPLSPIEI
eukprot:scaffold1504_cov417-Prasinococcus_capsulatus_cf.AAC.9